MNADTVPDQSSIEAFEAIVARFDSQMYVVTARHGDERAGCLVGFATQGSIEPKRFVVCISKTNATAQVVAATGVLVVHPLRRSQLHLAKLFGEETGEEVDKFARCGWRPGPDATPVLDGCDWFAGRIIERLDLGDHVGHLIEIVSASEASQPSPGGLGFQDVQDLDAGHEA